MHRVGHRQAPERLKQGLGSLSDWRVIGVLLAMTAGFVALILRPDLIPFSVMWAAVVVASAFANSWTSAALGFYGLALSVAGGFIVGAADTTIFWVRMGAFVVVAVIGVLLSAQRVKREAILTEQATTDELTGLASRRLLIERFEAQSQLRQSEQASAVLFADLDGFKAVNDSLGHAAGDEVLRRASERLLACTRAADTLARFGGDEFVMACPSVDGGEGLDALCSRIIDAFSPPFHVSGRDVVVGISIGAALAAPGAKSDPTMLIAAADRALIECKQGAPGTYRVVTV